MNKTVLTQEKKEKDTTKCLKVVIIEDFKLTRVGLRCALNTNEDINVVGECDNAIIGLEVIGRVKPDVVLMDLGLPEMNGLEATVKIKENWPNIKVIALTSHEMEDEVLVAFASGMNAYCLKDI
ncbi:response regulator transcription factor, partial [bacterium]|nr:response regulator transcription factor [bacterium]